MNLDLSAISALLQRETAEARSLDTATVDGNATSVTGYVIGFVGDRGRLTATKPDASRTNAAKTATWQSLSIAITAIKTVPASDDVRRHPDDPTKIQLRAYVEAKPEVKRYYWASDKNAAGDGNDEDEDEDEEDAEGVDGDGDAPKPAASAPVPVAAAAAAQAKNAPKRKPEEEEAEEGAEKKKDQFAKKDRTNMTQEWVTVYPGMVLTLNIFDPKKCQGIIRGCLVDIEGFGASINLFMSKPNPKYNPGEKPEPRVGFNFNTTGLTYLRRINNPYELYKSIAPMNWWGTRQPRTSVSFDVSRKGKPQDLRVLHDVEVPTFVVVPYGSYLDFELGAGKGMAHMESLPIESVTDFAMDAKEVEGDNKGNAPVVDGMEAKQKQYPVHRFRMSFVPYKHDALKELQERTTHSWLLVAFTRMFSTIGIWGCPRASTLSQVMEVMPPLPSVALCQFDAKNTEGNKFNLTRDPAGICIGSVFFEVKEIAADLRGFLDTHAFFPSMEWFNKKFESCKQYGGLIHLDNKYPHLPNPFHDNVVGASTSKPDAWDIICLSDFTGYVNFLYSEKGAPPRWRLAVLTSQWFSPLNKHSKTGSDDQDRILREISRLSEQDADACLTRSAGAKYDVSPTAVSIIYAMRVHGDQRVAGSSSAEEI